MKAIPGSLMARLKGRVAILSLFVGFVGVAFSSNSLAQIVGTASLNLDPPLPTRQFNKGG